MVNKVASAKNYMTILDVVYQRETTPAILRLANLHRHGKNRNIYS